ncbi:MAG: 8-oxo-dGTP diphosphatase MutT [Alphaproteobacteria bacterium]|nr:8-oxo-dGTP diphosphatase MutT [Alphaproteobacteria bacterium]
MKIVGTAIIFNEKNEILIGQRPEGKDLAGLWEFPGGKKEEGETIKECIVREIREELDVECEVGEFLLEVVKEYKHGEFKLEVYKSRIKDASSMKALVHQDLKWVSIAKLDNYEFPPADIDIIKYLKEKN